MTKHRIDSTAAKVAALTADLRPLEPPPHVPLEGNAAEFWRAIVAQRSREEWTQHDLAFAADLANALDLLSRNRALLRNEGEVTGDRINPRFGVVKSLHAQVQAGRRSLGLHSAARGDHRDVLRRRAAARDLDDTAAAVAADDLLAKPKH